MPPLSKPAVARAFKQQLAYYARADLRAQAIDIVNQANSHTARTLIAFGEAVKANVADAAGKMGAIHEELAAEAHQAVIEAYANARAASEAHSGSYRATNYRSERNRRYAGGLLAEAISDQAFIYGDVHGIYYANVSILDDKAKQWYRLNFGAGGKAGSGTESVVVRWSNLEAFALGFEDAEPSEPFVIPGGRWVGGAAGSEFYPLSEVPTGWSKKGRRQYRKLTEGIRGEHWMEAGLEVIAQQLPLRYEELFRRIWEDAVAKGHSAAGSTSLKALPSLRHRGAGDPMSAISSLVSSFERAYRAQAEDIGE